MISHKTRTRRWNGRESQRSKVLWFWVIVGILLAIAIALMIASKDQPANASLEIWSAEMTVGQNGQTLMR